MTTLHYAAGNVRNQRIDPAAAAAGFNLADVNDAETLKSLPDNVKGLYWLHEAKGVTPSFVAEMNAIKKDPDLFGVFLADEPYPDEIKASDLKAESDWIHKNMPGVKTFIVACNLGSEQNPNYKNAYTVENTHIDLWGIDPYPIRSEMKSPDYGEIDRAIAAAQRDIGVSTKNIVPVFQAFGDWKDGDGGEWTMPTPEQERTIMDRFAKYVPNPAFDFAYAWGKQEGDTPLSESTALQAVFKEHNTAAATEPGTTDGASGGVSVGGSTGTDASGGISVGGTAGTGAGNDTHGTTTQSGSASIERSFGGWYADTFHFRPQDGSHEVARSDASAQGTHGSWSHRDMYTGFTSGICDGSSYFADMTAQGHSADPSAALHHHVPDGTIVDA